MADWRQLTLLSDRRIDVNMDHIFFMERNDTKRVTLLFFTPDPINYFVEHPDKCLEVKETLDQIHKSVLKQKDGSTAP